MKYCRDTTSTHPISLGFNNIIENINTIIRNEGYADPEDKFSNSDVALNMDRAELIVAQQEERDLNRSMDFAIGVRNEDYAKRKMLLVELRLNYSNPNNLNKNEIEGKVAGSIRILSDSIPVCQLYIFIFKTGHIQEAISRLFRMIPKINSNYVVMDIDTLKATYF